MSREDLYTGKTTASPSTTESDKYKIDFPLLEHEFGLLRDFIYQHFGIYFTDEKRWMLESKLSKLISFYSLKSFMDYYQFLIRKFYVNHDYTDPDFIELIRAVTNHETYFFREQETFQMLHKLIENESKSRFSKKQHKTCRILSAGCSTGEEVYSIVMWLLEHGIKKQDFFVLGVDIDPTVLETAHCGVYRPFSFRAFPDQEPSGQWKKYFSIVPTGEKKNDDRKRDYIVNECLRENVDFRQINILDHQTLKKYKFFDIILCRNVMIYFNDDSKQKAIENFAEILNPEGYLFLGHSESILHIGQSFEVVKDQPVLFYRKKSKNQ